MITDSDIIIIQGENDPPDIRQYLVNDIPDTQEPVPADLFDFTGSTVYLTITDKGQTLIAKNTTADAASIAVDAGTAKVTWTPTLAETRALPVGRLARFGYEWRNGAQQGALSSGFVNVKVSPNSD
jgi:hypothetical protein